MKKKLKWLSKMKWQSIRTNNKLKGQPVAHAMIRFESMTKSKVHNMTNISLDLSRWANYLIITKVKIQVSHSYSIRAIQP